MKKRVADLLESQWTAEKMITDPAELAKFVKYEVEPERSVATITFTRPETLNAVPVAALELVGDFVREAEVDDRVKVIVFKGEGACFGTGADGAELGYYIGYRDGDSPAGKRKPAQRQRMLPDRNLLFDAFQNVIANSLKATICQVHGYCYGGHMQIALVADIVIASPDATFTHPAFRYLGCAPQDMYQWIENLGVKKMKEIMLTMRPLTADEGERAGLVTKVVPRDELDQWVADYAQAISMMPLDGLMMGKSMMQMMMNARGKAVGETIGWVGHGWATNLALREGEYNFVKERRDKGLSKALRDRDEAVAPFFRLGRTRNAESGGKPTTTAAKSSTRTSAKPAAMTAARKTGPRA
jgi:enoyl-CoA hydratase